MMTPTPNPLIGTGLHAIGGVSASCCYLPYEKIKTWSYESFWLIQALFAWLIAPIVVGYLTVPNLFHIYATAPLSSIIVPILLGALYGFGSMAFGFGIRYIGYSLTYTISIGISAIVGTIVPLILTSTLISNFLRPGGGIFLAGMIVAFLALVVCGNAGYKKEKDLAESGKASNFNMKKGLILTVFGGVLSGIFGVALFYAKPVAELARINGAGYFEANAAQILPSLGCLFTNLIWFIILSKRKGSLKELNPVNQKKSTYSLNFILSAFGGSMWYIQFLFLGMANVRMGKFEFAGWGIHMFMLVFFSFVIGLIMKEWKDVKKKTFRTLLIALAILLFSFVLMTLGSMIGEGMI